MNKKILALAVPNIITNITIPLLGMSDTAIAGHLPSPLAIGAISIAAIIFNFVYWNFTFLRMGTSGFTAQAVGAGNMKAAVNTLLRSLLVAFVAGFAIIALQYFILKLAFIFIQTGPATQNYVAQYFNIYIWAAPFTLAMFAITGWFIGMQNARAPMYIAIITNIANIALSLSFVFIFDMGIRGLALGTLCAQLIAFGAAVLIWRIKYWHLKGFINLDFITNTAAFTPFFKVNGNIFLRSLGIITVSTFFTAASAKMGDTILAANALLLQLFILFSYIMDGFAFAAEALSGKYFGAKNTQKLMHTIKLLFAWAFTLSSTFTLIYTLFSNSILNLFTDKPAIIQTAQAYLHWALLFPIAGFAAFLWDGIFVGISAARQMRNAMFYAVAIFFSIYLLLKPFYGNNALWLAFISYLAMRSLMQTLMFKKIRL